MFNNLSPALSKKFDSRSLLDLEACLTGVEYLHSEAYHFANHYQ